MVEIIINYFVLPDKSLSQWSIILYCIFSLLKNEYLLPNLSEKEIAARQF